jgi:hypothetical protein
MTVFLKEGFSFGMQIILWSQRLLYSCASLVGSSYVCLSRTLFVIRCRVLYSKEMCTPLICLNFYLSKVHPVPASQFHR